MGISWPLAAIRYGVQVWEMTTRSRLWVGSCASDHCQVRGVEPGWHAPGQLWGRRGHLSVASHRWDNAADAPGAQR